MNVTRPATLAALGAFALWGCGAATTDEQAAANTAPVAETGGNGVAATVTGAAGSEDANGTPSGPGITAPGSVAVSSGMPVPGTDTPEHIVVNQDAANGSANRQ